MAATAETTVQKLCRYKNMNVIDVYVMTKTIPLGWSVRTMMLRVLTRGNKEFLMQISAKALQKFEQVVNVDRCYTFNIPGSIVKPNKGQDKHGVPGQYCVYAANPIGLNPCREVWPAQVPYDPTPLSDMNLKAAGTWVDCIGHATGPPGDIIPGGLPKRELEIADDGYRVIVELLQGNMGIKVKKGDVVAIRGAKISAYNGVRKISSAFSTHIAVNPTLPDELKVEIPQDGEPLRKAMRMTTSMPMTLADIKSSMEQIASDAQQCVADGNTKGPADIPIYTTAFVKEFTDEIFDDEPPYCEMNGAIRLKVKATLCDDGTEIPVTLWSEPCREIFQTDAGTLQGLWEECESQEGKTALIDALNANLTKKYTFQGVIKAWMHGKGKGQCQIQVSINAAEQPDDD